MELNKKLLNIFKKAKTTSDEDTYTCSYINDLETSIKNLMKFTNWTNLYSSGNNVIKYRYNAFMVEIRIYMQDAHTTDITTSALPSACRPSETVSCELTGEGLNYANLYTDGKIILHNNNAYAGGTMTYTLTN